MFTGIIETLGILQAVESSGSNKIFVIQSLISTNLKIDQSVSHNGVCLTVEASNNNTHEVTAVQETLVKSNAGNWKQGDYINLERCLLMNGRLDGHMVQGHVDATAVVIEKTDLKGSWEFTCRYPTEFKALLIEKGSISLNGISLTIYNVTDNQFSVAIIPYTYTHTNLQYLEQGNTVNLEFDMIGKYINRFLQTRG